MVTDDDILGEVDKSINNLYKAFDDVYYNRLVTFNEYLIKNIKSIIAGTITVIMMNKYYLRILNRMHRGSISLSRGKIDIYDFILFVGVEDEDEEESIQELIYAFKYTLYYENKIIFMGDIKIQYNTNSEMIGMDINSSYLNKLDAKRNRNTSIKDHNNFKSIIKEVNKFNDTLDILATLLDEFLDVDEVKQIMDRNVFIINNEEGEEDEN